MSEPTNKELAEEIKTLSTQLGVEVSLATNKAQLLEQLEGLRKQLAERAALAGGADGTDAPTQDPEPPIEQERSALDAEIERLAGEDDELAYRIRRALEDVEAEFDAFAEPTGILAEAARDAAQAFLRGVARRLEVRGDVPEIVRTLRARADAVDAHGVHRVAPGRSLSSPRRGVLGPGTTVDEHDVPGGADAFRALLERGVLVRS